MEFGSKHVYEYNSSDEDVISDEGFSHPVYVSEDEDDLSPPSPILSQNSSAEDIAPSAPHRTCESSLSHLPPVESQQRIFLPKCRKKHTNWDVEETAFPGASHKLHKIRKADTNVLSVNFQTLKEPSGVFTGEAELCGNCRSVLSHLSVLASSGEDRQKVWECEYCGQENGVDLMPEEIPKENDVTYMLSPPTTTDPGKSSSQSMLIFCVDISGSMGATTELNKQTRSTAVTYLRVLQSAVQSQIDQLITTNPDKRVAFLTFNNEVALLGDGTKEAFILAGDQLYDEERLFYAGVNFQIPDAIKNTNQKLSQTLWSLKHKGQTALGPALVCAIAMASRGSAGSQVIICTDGLANVGVGQLQDISTPDKLKEAQLYYEHIAELANKKGVTISVLTFSAAECRILELGQVADKTNGEVERVNPVDLMDGFGSILAKPILATNVSIRLTLHSRLYLREPGQSDNSWVERNVGNVTEDSELTFEYGIKNQKSEQMPMDYARKRPRTEAGVTTKTLTIDGKEHLPFQLQITYRSKDGSKCLRVITQAMPVTKDREEAERTSNLGVLQTHVIKSTADMALKGEFSNPRLKCLSNQKMVYRIGNKFDRKKEYRAWSSNVAQTENHLFSAQKQEEVSYGKRLSESSASDSDNDMEIPAERERIKKLKKSAKKAKKVQIRASTTMSDTFSTNLYKAKKKARK